MNKNEKVKNFNPNGARPKNGHFMGLPFTETEAEVVLLSAPWGNNGFPAEGGFTAPGDILQASRQLSLFDPDVPEAWKMGLCLRLPDEQITARGKQLQEKTTAIALFTERHDNPAEDSYIRAMIEEANKEFTALSQWLRQEALLLLDQKKRPGLIGGDSSAQLGLLEALGEKYNEFGILHLGARMGLSSVLSKRAFAPETLFTQALKLDSVRRLTLVGARFASQEEEKAAAGRENISVFYQHEIRRRLFRGHPFSQICGDVIRGLPDHIYLSLDLDALNPYSGFTAEECLYLAKRLLDAELEIIGFGLCGFAGQEQESMGQLGALLAYRLANLMGHSALR